ncbi:MAG: tetraacyldisaccharide 4'-kinase [Tannerellaceae bacterium]|jgi:tetraacyldisaccharide 4'-kinase|nr:tetraacyldisaccharide 4'-kinase [Tannerellaceae bacterium]
MRENDDIKLNYLLSPVALLYGLGISVRNLLFNSGIFPAVEFPVPVISIGNLAIGGTGKTPHTEYLIKSLMNDYRIAVLSRGYKRCSKGFLLAGESDRAMTLGDEAYQMKRKYPDVHVAVDGNRRRGISNLLQMKDKPAVVLLDDAYQHRYVTPSLSILLTDYHRLFYRDRVLPFGLLREPRSAMHRADGIIVTKCDENLRPIDYRIIEQEMNVLGHQQLFFTRIVYEPVKPVFPILSGMSANLNVSDNEVLVLTGVASPSPFIREAERRFGRVTTMTYPDHHNFGKQDITRINEVFARLNSPDKFILTTEKDAVRLLNNPFVPQAWKDILYYLPIRIDFCTETSTRFNDWVKNHIITFQRNNILR